MQESTFKQHLEAHSGRCSICDKKVFGDIQGYRKHMKIHREKFKCDICKKHFNSYDDIRDHMNNFHMEEKMYKCDMCEIILPEVLLEGHARKDHHFYCFHECPYCNMEFVHVTVLLDHLKSHRGDRPLQCSQCGRVFKRYGHYKNHQCCRRELQLKKDKEQCEAEAKALEVAKLAASIKVENDFSKKPVSKDIKNDKNPTDEKLLDIKSEAALDRNDSDDGNDDYIPDDCPDENTSEVDEVEVGDVHKEEVFCVTLDTKPSEEENFVCSTCLRKFRNRRSLRIHMEIHGEKRYQCDICAMSFVRSGQLKSHMTVHTKERPYQCEICSKQFSQTSVLRVHMRVHTGSRPYECKICEKRFTQSANYHRHLNVHTGAKPFSCIVCSRAFARSAALKKHAKIHSSEPRISTRTLQPPKKKRESQLLVDLIKRGVQIPDPSVPVTYLGDKPFPCKICRKTFSQSSILSVHMRIHTGERPYKCSECDKTFTQWTNYNRHLSVHTGIRPFSCTLCEKKFARLATLKIHEKTHGEHALVVERSENDDANVKTMLHTSLNITESVLST